MIIVILLVILFSIFFRGAGHHQPDLLGKRSHFQLERGRPCVADPAHRGFRLWRKQRA